MKSLEIEVIDYIISWIENVGVTYDMEVSCYEEEFKKIKQDLEILEIIRKNTYRRDYNSLEPSITFIVPSWLSKEDFNKVKQWLEENENE